jgi:hypothetical protein
MYYDTMTEFATSGNRTASFGGLDSLFGAVSAYDDVNDGKRSRSGSGRRSVIRGNVSRRASTSK